MNSILMIDDIGALGSNNHLLYDIPEDKKWFKQKTLGKVVVMGRKTFESLPNMKPLPDRTNVVITKDKNFHQDGVITVNSYMELEENVFSQCETQDIFFIGGKSIYDDWIYYSDIVYITRLHVKRYNPLDIDTFFSYFNQSKTLYIVKDKMFRLRSIQQKSVSYFYIKDNKRQKSSARCDFMVFQKVE